MAELKPSLPHRERRVHKRALPLPEVKFVPAGNPSLPTFVSLMLMITTFMIVLTSFSLHENTRMRDLLASVRATFAGAPGNAETGATPVAAASLLGEVVTGFTAAVPFAVVNASAGGDRLTLNVPLNTMIVAATGAASTDFANGMAAMARALSQKPGDLDAEIELRFTDDALSAAHARALAMAAVKSGIAPARLFVVTGPGIKDNLTILVRLDPRQIPAPGSSAGQ